MNRCRNQKSRSDLVISYTLPLPHANKTDYYAPQTHPIVPTHRIVHTHIRAHTHTRTHSHTHTHIHTHTNTHWNRMYTQQNVGCGQVYMGANGCKWAYMGVVGCGGTGGHKNKTSKHKNGLTGYVRGACMAGKFPGKKHTCSHRHKGVMGDSGGWEWIRVGAGGCMDTQQTQNKAKIVICGCAGHNCGQTCGGGGNGHKDGVVTTRSPQVT